MPKAEATLPSEIVNAFDSTEALRDVREREAYENHPLLELSFIRNTRRLIGIGYRNFWAVKPSGDYQQDCVLGAGLAAELTLFIKRHPNEAGAAITSCVKQMIQAGKITGVEVGFLDGLANLAISGALPLRAVGRYQTHET